MDRRSFLQTLGAVTLSQLLGACQQNNRTALQVNLLQKTLPPQLVDKFRSNSNIPLQISLKSSTQEIFTQLQKWNKEDQKQRSEKVPSEDQPKLPSRLASLGDYWLPQAIQQNLIQPLSADDLNRWSALAPQWQQLVRRDLQGNPSAEGKIWGAPYRWGATMIAFRKDKFRDLGWQPQDWSDLWRSELKEHISLLDQPREVIGLTLKKLGQSYNLEDLDTISELPQTLKELNEQTLFYASSQYLEPLILGDTWAAVGWSSDILPTLAREPDLEAVFPASGSALWADLWVQVQPSETINQWINYWWEDTVANNLSKFTDTISPLLSTTLPVKSQSHRLVAAPKQFERSEFLFPLSPPTLQQYERLWQAMRIPV
ncbi:extracellular solute-binding protein [Acaryochloris marina]|uniref:ABC transporter, periplasmic solute-binding protein n=1 Tax=Acaryochloris marina (strain MBIC 11017) TaxID=329726 RepID=B0C8D9_ACAM1|nr:extracellular solute-binding protein [Acaryochloris marina]ABW30094.1 ABC transporter, periplasmic solute-binding protein [Acaryochloris marina MBIC11017]